MSEPGSKNWLKVTIIVLIMGIAASFAYARIKKVTPGSVANNGATGDFESSPEDRRAQFESMAQQAKITPEQMKQLEEAREKMREGNGDWREMRTVMQDILTTPQRETLRAGMQNRMAQRDAKMRAAMSEQEYQRYQEKRNQRRGGRGGRGGQGGLGAERPPGAV